jgi:hypothetical protein
VNIDQLFGACDIFIYQVYLSIASARKWDVRQEDQEAGDPEGTLGEPVKANEWPLILPHETWRRVETGMHGEIVLF